MDHASANCKQQNMQRLSNKWGKEGSTPRFNQASVKGRGQPRPFRHCDGSPVCCHFKALCHQSHCSALTALEKEKPFISLGHHQFSLISGIPINFLAPECQDQGTISLLRPTVCQRHCNPLVLSTQGRVRAGWRGGEGRSGRMHVPRQRSF